MFPRVIPGSRRILAGGENRRRVQEIHLLLLAEGGENRRRVQEIHLLLLTEGVAGISFTSSITVHCM